MISIRPEEQSEKMESCQKNLWNEIQLKGHKTEIDTRTEWKGVGKLGWLMSDKNCNIFTRKSLILKMLWTEDCHTIDDYQKTHEDCDLSSSSYSYTRTKPVAYLGTSLNGCALLSDPSDWINGRNYPGFHSPLVLHASHTSNCTLEAVQPKTGWMSSMK